MTTTEIRSSLPAGYATKAMKTGRKVWETETGGGYILKSKRGDDESEAGAIRWAWANVDAIAIRRAAWAAHDAALAAGHDQAAANAAFNAVLAAKF